jgi:hypothetical protein
MHLSYGQDELNSIKLTYPPNISCKFQFLASWHEVFSLEAAFPVAVLIVLPCD